MPAKDIDEYISNFAPDVQERLQSVRDTIRGIAKDAVETINYAIPTYKLNGNLVHFAAFKHHIGFYPGPDAITAFVDELAGYKTSKGAIQFPFDIPIPLDLIKRITIFRIEQNLEKNK